MSNETWLPVKGYEGLYEVSDHGNVRSFHKGYARPIRPGNLRGYRQMNMAKDGVHKPGLVHRLVAIAFLGDPPTRKHQVNHKDFNHSNNHVSNLEWLTRLENIKYSFDKKHFKAARGEATGSNKLKESQVIDIRARYAAGGVTLKRLADEYGVSQPTIHFIVHRRKWKHIP